MSLAHSHTEPLGDKADATLKLRLKAPEPRPRMLQRPDACQDTKSSSAGFNETRPQKAYMKPSGNSKPQEPGHFQTRWRTTPLPKDREQEHAEEREDFENKINKMEDWREREAAEKELRRMHGEPLPPHRQFDTKMVRPRVAGHAHPKPWSSSPQPGHKENPGAGDKFHRTWTADATLVDKVGLPLEGLEPKKKGGKPSHSQSSSTLHGKVSKWNSQRLKQHYAEQDKALFKLRPHDEIYATRTNMKYWTHLEDAGAKCGGQHKLSVVPQKGSFDHANPEDAAKFSCQCAAACKRHSGVERNGWHLKGGLYTGKFENIKHQQLIFSTKGEEEDTKSELKRDKRPAFDNRLKDDAIRHIHETDKTASIANYDIFRPAHTFSCPQLGADFVNR